MTGDDFLRDTVDEDEPASLRPTHPRAGCSEHWPKPQDGCECCERAVTKAPHDRMVRGGEVSTR